MSGKRSRWFIGGTLAIGLIAGGTAIAVATGDGDDDEPLAGTALERATRAALEHTGGGTVIETEIGDDGAAYGVEIRLNDGGVVEVRLDQDFSVIGQEGDADAPNEHEGEGQTGIAGRSSRFP